MKLRSEVEIASELERRTTPEPNSGCWLWTGTLNSKGYGVMGAAIFGLKKELATRLMWRTHYGDPGPMHVLHRCDNPACVNPAHLWLGTHLQNMQDKARKGRAPRFCGENSFNSRLTDGQVLEMRRLFDSGEARQIDIAKRFNLTRGQVSLIVRRVRWSHLGEVPCGS